MGSGLLFDLGVVAWGWLLGVESGVEVYYAAAHRVNMRLHSPPLLGKFPSRNVQQFQHPESAEGSVQATKGHVLELR